MRKLLKNGLLPVAILGFAAFLAWLMVNSRAELPRRESTVAPPVVDTLLARPGPVPVTVRSRGTVTAKYDIELVSEVSGRVVWVSPRFVQGGLVEAGEPLLRIDPIDYEVALSDARAALASAEFSLAEVQVVVMRAAIEEAEARVEAAKARLRQAEIDLKNTEITAPFDAIVDAKEADLGQYVQGGTAVMQLMSTDLAEIRLPLLASDLPLVGYGQNPDGSWQYATLGARFGATRHQWQARLVRLERRVDEQTRVFYLVAEVDHPYDESIHDPPLSLGLFVEAEIAGQEVPDATRLPRSALHDGSFVYVVEQDTLQRRAVTVLRREQNSVIVGAGLSAGDQVVTSRLDLMAQGMPVTVEASG
jgi:RND family efflux transporter MFP subunit